MPASNARAIDKARTLPVDAVILDLEDSVAPEAKAAAREQMLQSVTAGGFGASVKVGSVDAAPYSIAQADFNTDGKPDLVTANNGGGNVSVLLNSYSAVSSLPCSTRT